MSCYWGISIYHMITLLYRFKYVAIGLAYGHVVIPLGCHITWGCCYTSLVYWHTTWVCWHTTWICCHINMFTTLIHSFIPTSESLVDLFGNVRERRSFLRRVPRSLRRHFRFFAELRRVQGHLASISRENVHRGDSWKTMQEEEEVEEERRKRGRINHCACN